VSVSFEPKGLAVLTDSSLALAASSATRFSSASLASRSFKSFFSCSDLSPSFFNLSFSASSAKRAFLPSSDSILIGTGVDDLGRTGVGATAVGSGVVLLADASSKAVPSGRLIWIAADFRGVKVDAVADMYGGACDGTKGGTEG